VSCDDPAEFTVDLSFDVVSGSLEIFAASNGFWQFWDTRALRKAGLSRLPAIAAIVHEGPCASHAQQLSCNPLHNAQQLLQTASAGSPGSSCTVDVSGISAQHVSGDQQHEQ
jgi:hypothetical protein